MSTRRLRIEWSKGHKVTAYLASSPRPRSTGVLLAHGAGAGQRSPFIVTLRDRLAAAGYPVLTFDYPYMEAGRRRPDAPRIALQCHRAALARLGSYCESVVVAGKSMGGRLGSHVVADGDAAAGVIYYGYPLRIPGTGKERSLEHLSTITAPQLFISGTRDALCPLDALQRAIVGVPDATVAIIQGADHSFRVRRDAPLSPAEVVEALVAISLDFLAAR